MSNYYVSGCVADGDDVSICDDSVAQFWTLYHRNEEGLSEGIIDCMFREDAETAMRVYEERDTLAAENVTLKGYIDDECYIANPTGMDYIGAYASSVETPDTDAWLNSVRAEGADKVAEYHFVRIDALKEVSRQGHLFHKAAYSDAVNVARLFRAGKDGE